MNHDQNGWDPHCLRVLEFQQVLAQVSRHCQWQPGREVLQAIQPARDIDELHDRQAVVREAIRVAEDSIIFGLGGLPDIRDWVKMADRGQILEPSALIGVREVAVASRKLATILVNLGPTFPLLSDRARYLGSFVRIENEVLRCIHKDLKVKDDASPALLRLRHEVRDTEQQIQRHLQEFLRDNEILKLLQEPIVTQRHGRYVLPVKSDSKSRFPGIVIDQSGSGATLFMEPLNVLPLSNSLRAAQLGEAREVETVLADLTGMVAAETEALLLACDELAQLDALAAQAAYALKVEGHLPTVEEDGALRLVRARHPLLLAHGIKAVPISLELDISKRTLVLTGPNTGGKTVALKTVGLLCLLGLCGLPVPASARTCIPFLTSIWADIGDDQSIAQSLSTFSAHLTQILRILPNANSRSLVLLDELGAGTDPIEGAALGIALLETLHRQQALTVVTTHLSEIKVYANKASGFENAAVEFDAESLSPTFNVVMGIPGRSNALLIASRLGLPDKLLHRAREMVGGEQVAVSGLLDDLEREREVLRGKEEEALLKQRRADGTTEDYNRKIKELEVYRDQILRQAAVEAQEIVQQSRQRSHGLLRDFRTKLERLEQQKKEAVDRWQRQAEQLREQRMQMEESDDGPAELDWEELERLTRPELESPLGSAEKAEGSLAVALPSWPSVQKLIGDWSNRDHSSETPSSQSFEDEADHLGRVAARTLEADLEQLQASVARAMPALPTEEAVESHSSSSDLFDGCNIYSRRFGQEGTLLKLRGDKAEVKLGSVRVSLPISDLEMRDSPKLDTQEASVSLMTLGMRDVSSRVDLRGMNVDDAIYQLNKAIDQAVLAHLPKLEVIHGKGTGVLRQGLQKYLKEHPAVADQRLGEVYEGSYGVTIVTLKD
jgi:DNA mismatch repair protein MutS2